jgi:hypothetical protein
VSLPVVVLGFGAALSHLLRGESGEPAAALEVNPEGAPNPLSAPVPESAQVGAPESAPKAAPRVATRTRARPGVKPIKAPTPVEFYAAELAAGEMPSLRRIRADMHVGQPRAQQIQTELASAPKPAAVAA